MENEKARFQPYEGGDPYIFASYSHADSETVLPILDALHKRGFRVWYDAGIGWTEKWKDVVADHVAECAVCMAFISAAYRDSKHCNAELNLAESNNKTILRVYLEDGIRLSSGLEMYISGYQSVKWREFSNVGVFLDRMEREKAFQSCKGQLKQICRTGRVEPDQQNQAHQPEWNYDRQIRWNLSEDGVLTIAASNPNSSVEMPDFIFKKNRGGLYGGVVDLLVGEKMFIKIPWEGIKKQIISLIIDCSITTISAHAFSGCTSMTSVTIPDSVKKIGEFAFCGCTGLTSVHIPDSVIKIEMAAFCDCDNLKDISLPANTEYRSSSFPPNAKVTVRR